MDTQQATDMIEGLITQAQNNVTLYQGQVDGLTVVLKMLQGILVPQLAQLEADEAQLAQLQPDAPAGNTGN